MKHSQQTNRGFFFTLATAGKVSAAVLALTLTCALHGAPVDAVPGRILVKPHAGVAEADLHGLFLQHGAVETDKISAINVRILKVPEAARDHVLEALKRHANIEFAERDVIVPPSLTPNDPSFNNQWHLPKMQCPTAWDMTCGSATVTIAICDSGVDATHPDLAAAIVPGWNFYNNNSDTSDVDGHGTGVAGTAAAIGNNGVGVTGIAMNCRIMPLRISDANGYAAYSTMAQAITYAADHGARVANLSFKASNSSSVSSAAQYLNSKGGVLTLAAGNDGAFDATSDNPYLLIVSATDSTDTLASWSCTGNNVDLSAPGVSILLTTKGGGYGWGSGTSFAAPCVAGVAALVISANPSLSATQVMSLLKQSADDLGAAGWDPSYGWGRVNAYKAVLAATGGTPPPSDTTPPTTSITAPAGGSTVSGTVSVSVAASDNVGVTKVELYVNGALAGTSTSAPATLSWNTTTCPNGLCNLQARAYDAAGKVGTSSTVSVSVQNTVRDLTAPTVQIAAPTAGATLSGVASVNVSATDNVGVAKVEWYLNGALAGSSTTGSFSWDTTTFVNGSCTLQAKASDAAGNIGSSTTMNVTVQNITLADTTAPTVQITSPTGGATVVKNTKVYVTSSDNVGVTKVDLLVDGKPYATSASAVVVFSWNTLKLAGGSHTLQAVAYDAAAHSTRSTIVTVYK